MQFVMNLIHLRNKINHDTDNITEHSKRKKKIRLSFFFW